MGQGEPQTDAMSIYNLWSPTDHGHTGKFYYPGAERGFQDREISE